MEFSHVSVLLHEAVDALNIRPDGVYLDGTAGGGGHSFEIAGRLGENGRLIAVDRDEEAVEAATKRLEPFRDRVAVVRENYGNFDRVLDSLGIGRVDGILLDLGVSSHQFDDPERGFSYRFDAPLDMRMDRREEKSAYDVVNGYSEEELYRIIRDYGEDGFAKNIAKHIVMKRSASPIRTTAELSEIIKGAIPAKIRAKGGHPAKQTFQAIRIEVNGELDVLKETLERMRDRLNDGGKLVIITFHSLEDRIVKNAFRNWEHPCTCPPDLPVCVCGKVPYGKAEKSLTASPEELEQNPRSSSARLRVFERRVR